jgi:Tol biopolymer transport system component/predicted Ser/Thr protein kinase
MSLSAGDKLGPYEIVAPIGAGGMGDVYKASDKRLDRIVAIKVSAAQFSERFEREARAVAALNHSNICTLHDVGPDYLVMEYIEGTTLKGPLPVDRALKYAAQICDALDAAHKKGITHRDLKPANILVTKAGVKLLDFGLAKMGPAIQAGEGTMTMALTGKGEILGTFQYMSPEQVTGQDAGPRSDIFSFGLVLYEMLTGKRAFEGSSPASVIAAIMERPAPSIATIAPPALDRLLQRCLAKDPDDRWQSARDLKAELDWIASAPGEAIASSAPSLSWFGRLPWIAAAMLAVVALGLGLAAYRATRPAELKPLVRLDVDLGTGVSLGSSIGPGVIISPDGTRLAYVSQRKLFTRRMDQPKAVELAGTGEAYAPFFSPDGQWLAFFAQGKLKKISVVGGSAVALCDAPLGRGGSWGEDGTIIAASNNSASLSRIPSAGGAPAPVIQLAPGEATQRWPQILPGGKAVLFTSHTSTAGFDGANIEVITLADHRRKTLQRGGTFGRYLPASQGPGHLVYINKGTVFAVPFDPEKLEARGAPSPVLEELAYSAAFGFAQFDFSRNGTLVYRSGGASQADLVTVQWLDAAGQTEPLLAKPGIYQRPRLSPDGKRLAFSDGSDMWVYEARRDILTRLTFGGANELVPVWTPDGRYIVFSGVGSIWWVRSDGGGKPQLLIQGKNPLYPFSFAPDGKRLTYNEANPTTAYDIWTTPIESDGAGLRAGKPQIFLQTSADERNGTFSSDGRWLAYASNESGNYEVYVRAFPDKGSKWQISNAGGVYPVWSRNGQELFFRADDNRIMVAPYVAKTDSFVSGKPRVWSDKRLADFGTIGISNYDVAPDGKRIAALMPVEGAEAQQSQNHVIFLENFSDELQRKVSSSK